MKFPITLLTVFVSVIILLALTPIFISSTYDSEDRHNDNVGWARFNYTTNKTADISVNISEGVVTLGGTAPQSGAVEDMFIWADNNLSVYLKDGTAYYMGKSSGGFVNGSLSGSFTISKDRNSVKISDDENNYTFPASSWAYIPSADGSYGSFINGEDSHINAQRVTRAYIGGLLDFYAYNNVNSGDYALNLIVLQDDDVISGASWSGGVTNE